MPNVLLVGPYYRRCDLAPSPATRLEGYGRFLRESGWSATFVIPACRCTVAELGMPAAGEIVERDAEIVFDAADEGAVRQVRERIAAHDGSLLVLRPIVQAPLSLRWWTALEARVGVPREVIESRVQTHLCPALVTSPADPNGRARMAAAVVGAYARVRGAMRARERALRSVVDEVLRHGRRPDVVLGSHCYIAEVRAAGHPKDVPLAIELRDAIWRGWRVGWEVLEVGRLFRLVRRSSMVIHVTSEEQALDRWWLPRRARRTVIEAGFDPDEWERVRTKHAPAVDAFVLRFVGTILPHRDLARFGSAFASFLAALDDAQRARVRFEYVGHSVDEAASWAATLGTASENVHIVGPVTRSAALCAMASATVLVLPTYRGTPGGRFYEYLGARRPIFAIGEPDPYVAGVLDETGAGVATSDPALGASLLRGWFDRWRSGDPLPAGVPERLERYSRRGQAEKLAAALGSIIGR
jgi:glycosyltransferase involved in cell wall biosynthesis